MGCQVNHTTLLFSLEDDAVHGDRSGVTGSRTCTKCRDFQGRAIDSARAGPKLYRTVSAGAGPESWSR
jgi:hypothetical protein